MKSTRQSRGEKSKEKQQQTCEAHLDGVLVEGDVNLVADLLHLGPRQTLRPQVPGHVEQKYQRRLRSKLPQSFKLWVHIHMTILCGVRYYFKTVPSVRTTAIDRSQPSNRMPPDNEAAESRLREAKDLPQEEVVLCATGAEGVALLHQVFRASSRVLFHLCRFVSLRVFFA